jgi:hypothetical protein
MNFGIGVFAPGRGACRLGAIKGMAKRYQLSRGVPLAAQWPSDVSFAMDADYPDDLRTDDFIDNTDNALVVSDRVRQLVEPGLRNNELLPITIFNHKGRKELGPFFILHQVLLQDCLDLQRTRHEVGHMNADLLIAAAHLVLDENRIDPEVSLFRMAHLPFVPVFRKDLMGKIEGAGFAGLKFVDPKDYVH